MEDEEGEEESKELMRAEKRARGNEYSQVRCTAPPVFSALTSVELRGPQSTGYRRYQFTPLC